MHLRKVNLVSDSDDDDDDVPSTARTGRKRPGATQRAAGQRIARVARTGDALAAVSRMTSSRARKSSDEQWCSACDHAAHAPRKPFGRGQCATAVLRDTSALGQPLGLTLRKGSTKLHVPPLEYVRVRVRVRVIGWRVVSWRRNDVLLCCPQAEAGSAARGLGRRP